MNTNIRISTQSAVPFRNRAFFCIGSGRMGLALTGEYQEELTYVQHRLRFSHIRAHGLFCDDLAVCRRVDGAHGNPLKLWHDLGEPPCPTDALLQLLREAAVPQVSSRRVSPPGGEQRLDFLLRPGAVLYFEFRPCPLTPDTGYRYEDAVLGRAIREGAV